jgi:hypothetical protein
MEEIFTRLLGILEEKIPNDVTRREIYAEIIPVIYWHDPDLAELLKQEDDIFAEVMEEVLEEHAENFED